MRVARRWVLELEENENLTSRLLEFLIFSRVSD